MTDPPHRYYGISENDSKLKILICEPRHLVLEAALVENKYAPARFTEPAWVFTGGFTGLHRALVEHRPTDVYIHCERARGSCVLRLNGEVIAVEGLKELLRTCKNLRRAVIYGSRSGEIAAALAATGVCAVALPDALPKKGLRAYSAGYLIALFRGHSFEESHEQGEAGLLSVPGTRDEASPRMYLPGDRATVLGKVAFRRHDDPRPLEPSPPTAAPGHTPSVAAF